VDEADRTLAAPTLSASCGQACEAEFTLAQQSALVAKMERRRAGH
jgi:hypothetical protein